MYAENSPMADERIYDLGIPVLGICYGMQLMTHHLKGKVERANKREYGKAAIQVTNPSLFFGKLDETQNVWMSHGDLVVETPEGFQIDASSEHCPIAAMSHQEKKPICSAISSGSTSFGIWNRND